MQTHSERFALAFVWHGVLMAAALATLTACQSSALPQLQPLVADSHEAGAAIGEEQPERTEAAASLAPVAGAAPPRASASDPAASSGYAVRWLRPLQGRDENDGVEVINHGWRRGVQLVVTSKSGAGEVEVEPTDTVWPRQVEVRFQYASGKPFEGLERLYLQVDAWPGDLRANLDPMDNFVFWQRDGAMRVDLPAGWLHDRQTLHMAWADRLGRSLVVPGVPKTPSAE